MGARALAGALQTTSASRGGQCCDWDRERRFMGDSSGGKSELATARPLIMHFPLDLEIREKKRARTAFGGRQAMMTPRAVGPWPRNKGKGQRTHEKGRIRMPATSAPAVAHRPRMAKDVRRMAKSKGGLPGASCSRFDQRPLESEAADIHREQGSWLVPHSDPGSRAGPVQRFSEQPIRRNGGDLKVVERYR